MAIFSEHQAANHDIYSARMETDLAMPGDAVLQIISVERNRASNSEKHPRNDSCTGNIRGKPRIKNSQNEPSR
jgi:hypothetical protein